MSTIKWKFLDRDEIHETPSKDLNEEHINRFRQKYGLVYDHEIEFIKDEDNTNNNDLDTTNSSGDEKQPDLPKVSKNTRGSGRKKGSK